MAKNSKVSKSKKSLEKKAKQDALKEIEKIKEKKVKGDGILYCFCPVCGFKIRYKRGRKKNPKIKEVNDWLDSSQCPKCGKFIRVRDPKGLSEDRTINHIS